MSTINTDTIEGSTAVKTWRTIKRKYPDALVMIRMNNCYHCFERDAQLMHTIAGIKLHACLQENEHCRIEAIQSETILKQLIKAGYRVAICDAL